MRIVSRLLCAFIFLILMSCQPGRRPSTYSKDLLHLRSMMSGDFSSFAQAARDSLFQDVMLRMCPVWTDDPNGVWLYVEQAFSVNPGKPYRQRVYKLERLSGKRYVSKVFTLPDEASFVGGCQNPKAWEKVRPGDLVAREGCAVYLTRLSKDHFKGATRDTTCESKLRGASYATSEVEITHKGLITLDRGYAKNGKQVWGSKNGPYVFERLPVQ